MTLHKNLWNVWLLYIISVAIIGSIMIALIIIDPFPATDEECHRLDGTNEHVAKWCDCKISYHDAPLNKSYTECHAKEQHQ